LEKQGYKEVTLTGVNIAQYKNKKLKEKNKNLSDLLKLILKQTKIERIRLGSLDPRLITDELLELYAKNSERLLPHFHLSLQSGSNKILKTMGRGYTTEKYFKIIKKARKKNQLFSFTTDIIVGFPGESQEDFFQTCEFVKKCEFTKVHIFPYSRRPGTPAATMLNQVQDSIKKERIKKLTKIVEEIAKKFAQKFIGIERPVLFENKKNKYWEGFTPEYVRVMNKSKENLQNKIKKIKI